MISEAEARQHVASRAHRLPPVSKPLHESLGLILAEDVVSDLDSPPYDKALVDGYAVCSSDFADATEGSPTMLRVLEEVTAGRTPTQPLAAGFATRIMTGAPLPVGCDAVIMVEQSEIDADLVRLRGQAKPEQNLLRAGAAVRKGDVVAHRGATIRAVEVGVLAEAGWVRPQVIRRPTVAIISTGDELVGADQKPAPGQIRNSNGPMLEAQSREAGADPVPLGTVGDDVEQLERAINSGLKSDVLVLSGGVSAGVLDLVPPALQRSGVERVFHKVALKPGKPVWFGQHRDGALVFGLPGNPVGSLVCFERLVKPALRQMAGMANAFADQDALTAELAEDFFHRGPRPTYRPARRRQNPADASWIVTPLAWQGSADLRALADANCLIAFPPGDCLHHRGDRVTCYLV